MDLENFCLKVPQSFTIDVQDSYWDACFRKALENLRISCAFIDDNTLALKNGEGLRYKFTLPEVLGVEVKNNPEEMEGQYDENGKYQKPTVIVTFADGTSEKAIASEDDTFSLEQGISICYTKKLLSMLTTDSGSKVYNQILHNALKTYKTQQRRISEAKRDEQLEKERLEGLAAKRAKRKAKYEAKKREREISVQAEAYARALRMVNQVENK